MPVSARYDIGQAVNVTDTVTIAGVLTDPGQLKVKIEDPAGNVATDTWPGGSGLIVRDSVGVFHATADTSTPSTTFGSLAGSGGAGVWRARYWTPAGQTGQHATDYEFMVDDSELK